MKKIILFLLLLTSTISYARQNEEEEKKQILQKLNSFFKVLENKDTALYNTLVFANAQIWTVRNLNDTLKNSVRSFAEDMKKVGADWTLVYLSGAVHSFTDVTAKTPGKSMYDEKATRRSYLMMRNFFAEAFAG